MTNAASILSDDTPVWQTARGGDLWSRFRQTFAPSAPGAFGTNEPAYLALARTGDENALAQVYAEHKDALWRLCRRLCRSEADAEDVLQNTFVKAFAALPKFRGDASLKTWLFRIALNEVNTLMRRSATKETGLSADDAAQLPAPNGGFLGGHGNGHAEQVAVRALLSALKPEFRAVLILRYWEELSYEEIASVLDAPLPSVKMRLHRAKEAFRRLYHEETP